ncbi:MAG: c-type cytochrome [Candidatus Acidiferrales bacterium]
MDKRSKARTRLAVRFASAMTIAAFVWIPAKVIARAPSPRQPATQQADAGTPKSAAEVFKNVQVLKDIPADQLLPSMRYITAALGVRCDYCHEADHFDSDDKPTKQRARNMMKMMFAINSDNFNGRRDVTCYTCHRGAAKAASTPGLADAAGNSAGSAAVAGQGIKAPSAPEPSEAPSSSGAGSAAALPSVDEILAKYVQAIGGTEAIQKASTRIEKGTVEGPRGLHATIETYRKAPNEAFAVLHAPNGDVTEGVNGKIGWGKRANGEVTEESGDELARSKQWAAFYPGEQFKKDYARFQVKGTESIGGHDAYAIMAWWTAGGADRIYFDVQSGLLMRISHRIESPLGGLPLETDYEDYRDVSGLRIPFTVRIARVDGTTTYKWQQMDANVPLDESRFEKPAEKAASDKPAKRDSKQ